MKRLLGGTKLPSGTAKRCALSGNFERVIGISCDEILDIGQSFRQRFRIRVAPITSKPKSSIPKPPDLSREAFACPSKHSVRVTRSALAGLSKCRNSNAPKSAPGLCFCIADPQITGNSGAARFVSNWPPVGVTTMFSSCTIISPFP